MAIKLQIRRDIKTNWDANSGVILLSGEIGYETDTRNMKIGDGATTWSSLKYQAPYYTGTNSTLATTTLSVDQTNNRVGIGTSSPLSPLHVNRSSYGANITFGVSSTFGSIGQDASNNNVMNAWTGHVFQTGSTERVRISSTGLVGIGTDSPGSTLDVAGGQIRFRSTGAYSQPSTGAGAIYYDADTGNLTLDARAPGGNTTLLFRTSDGGNGGQRMSISSAGVQVTGTTTSSGAMTVTTGGLTVTAGGLTVTAGSVSLPSNSVSLGTVAQIDAGNFLGNSSGSTANVAAVTQAQARTMLGLGTSAYLTAPSIITPPAWTDLAIAAAANKDFSASVLSVGVPTLVNLGFSRTGATNAVVSARLVLAAGEIVTILNASDNGSQGTSWSPTAANSTASWMYRGETAYAASGTENYDYPRPITLAGSKTYAVLRWQMGGTAGSDGPRAWVFMLRHA